MTKLQAKSTDFSLIVFPNAPFFGHSDEFYKSDWAFCPQLPAALRHTVQFYWLKLVVINDYNFDIFGVSGLRGAFFS